MKSLAPPIAAGLRKDALQDPLSALSIDCRPTSRKINIETLLSYQPRTLSTICLHEICLRLPSALGDAVQMTKVPDHPSRIVYALTCEYECYSSEQILSSSSSSLTTCPRFHFKCVDKSCYARSCVTTTVRPRWVSQQHRVGNALTRHAPLCRRKPLRRVAVSTRSFQCTEFSIRPRAGLVGRRRLLENHRQSRNHPTRCTLPHQRMSLRLCFRILTTNPAPAAGSRALVF